MELTTIQQWLGIIVAAGAAIGVILGFVRWVIHNIVRDIKKDYLDGIKHELQPNSGQSVKDQVTRLETSQIKIHEELESTRKEFGEKLDDSVDELNKKIDRHNKEVHDSIERIYQLIIEKL